MSGKKEGPDPWDRYVRSRPRMHPIDDADRIPLLRESLGVGLCNITECCTEVCPEDIPITDNAIIPLKERAVDRFYDPLRILWRKISGK